MSINQPQPKGFTVVELLIAVVVIAILAGLTVVGFSMVRKDADKTSLSNDLQVAAKHMDYVMAKNGGNNRYPTTFPSDVTTSNGNILQLTQSPSNDNFCINGYGKSGLLMSIDMAGLTREYLCPGALIGSPIGGSVPAPPRGSNLVTDFSTWTLTGGVSYDAATGELRLSSSSGSATSPLVRVDGSTQARITVDAYATTASPSGSPNSQVYWGSRYHAADGVTLATNTTNHTGNGNAQNLPLNAWRNFTWTTATGPNVKYVKFIIHSHPTGYTSNNRYKNPQVIIP